MLRVLIFTSFLIVISCREDQTVVNSRAILGNWQIVQATKDGEAFEAIGGGYFEFGLDEKFQTNIPILPNGSPYVVNKEMINFANDTIKYKINEVTDSILIVESVIRDIDFRFICKKKH